MKVFYGKQKLSLCAAVFFLILSLLPVFFVTADVLAESAAPIPEAPYEQILFENGSWYLEYVRVGEAVHAVAGYRGSYDTDLELLTESQNWAQNVTGDLAIDLESETEAAPIPFTISRDSFVTAIHVPYSYSPDLPDLDTMNVMILDTEGAIFGPFSMVPELIQGEQVPQETETADEDGAEVLVSTAPPDIHVAYSVLIAEGLLLEKGQYYLQTTDNARVVRNTSTKSAGAVMLLGVDYDAWVAYVEALAALEEPVLYDFTGRYSVDVDTLKTSTLMGPVNPPTSSFSLHDFELTVLDEGETIQLVGKYEGLPFSQICPVLDRSENWLSAEFGAQMDLTKLPYKAKIGGNGVLVLQQSDEGEVTLELLGEGTFERDASSDEGADFNTYDLKVSGTFAGTDLPAFVAAALASRIANVGGVPGPDSASQAAAGALFPPLIAVVANAVQSALNAKDAAKKAKLAAAKKASGQHDKGWYKERYPGKTDDEIAMIMLADAMGNTDEPDDDPFSQSDEAVGSGSASDAADTGSQDEDWPEESSADEADNSEESQDPPEASEESPVEKPAEEPAEEPTPQDEKPQTEPETTKQTEPETMKVIVDHKGTVVEAVRDPATGEWINPETGNTLNLEISRTQGEEWQKDNQAIEKNRAVNDTSSSEWDKKLRDDDQARQEALKVQNVRDKIMSKYGTKNKDDTMSAIGKSRDADAAVANAYNNAGKVAGAYEEIAKVTVNVADAAVDGLGNATGPLGRGIRAGYKVAKGVAETTAEQGLNLKNIGSGLAKGGLDAASDFTNPKWSGKAQQALKSGLQIGSEIVGETTSSKGKGFVEGLKKGLVKAGTDAIPDAVSKGYGGDLVTSSLKNGQVRVAVNNAGKWSGRTVSKTVAQVFESQKNNKQLLQSGVKTAVNLTNEYGIKPRM